MVLHAVLAGVGAWTLEPAQKATEELVDIEIAPPPPPAEALPAEVARVPEPDPVASTDPASPPAPEPEPSEGLADAGVDAPIDAPVDAPRRRRDAAVDAADGEPLIAEGDAGVSDAGGPDDAEPQLAAGDAGVAEDATMVAAAGSGDGSGSGANAGSGQGPGSNAIATGSGSGVPGTTNEAAVDGAPTTAGTASNLLDYFPSGHMVTALIRFDRLRGTEWAAQSEQVLRPMPDYRVLFGGHDARIADKIETLVISSPRPWDATATTLVARTLLPRAALRDFLAATTPAAWSTARGGLVGRRTGPTFPGDQRVFLSPFAGWFLLAQPTDLGGLLAPTAGDIDTIEATGKLPSWLASVRTIEAESGTDRGPALVVTLAPDQKRLQGRDLGFLKPLATFERISIAVEAVKRGWLVRGNLKFAKERDATAFVTAAEDLRDSRVILSVVGRGAIARVVKNLSFAQSGRRVSYATSVSIADARLILAATAKWVEQYYAARP